MNFHQVSLKRNATYSWAVIILLALFEGSALMGIHMGHWSLWGTCMAVSAISIVSIWLYASRKWKLFTTANLILTKLLNNAIAPTTLGIVYLLLFIIHMGWLTDAAISLFLPVNKPQDVIFAMMVCCVGIAVLVCFFPKGKTEKNDDATKVFVTGVSAIGNTPEDYDSLNLIPLVRILQLAEENDRKCKLLILLSDSFEKNERTGEVLSKVMGLVNAGKCSSLDGCATILDKLEMVIREIVRREFPGRPWLNAKLEVEFTSACNYNGDFETSFKILTPRVNELDDVDHLLYFNCTPGTSTIGSLLTLLAIDGDRRLYYYNQEKMPSGLTEEQKLKFRESMLKPVDKTKIPLYNLLSQAMEKF